MSKSVEGASLQSLSGIYIFDKDLDRQKPTVCV